MMEAILKSIHMLHTTLKMDSNMRVPLIYTGKMLFHI